MAVINSKVRTFRPDFPFFHFLLARFRHVENYAHSIFVVVALNSLMCVGCIRYNNSMGLRSILGILKIGQRIMLIMDAFGIVR